MAGPMIPYFLAGLAIGSAALTNSERFIVSAMYIILVVLYCAVMYARTHIEEYMTAILPVRCTCGLLAILSARAVQSSFFVSSRRSKVIHQVEVVERKRRALRVITASHTCLPIHLVFGAGSASGFSRASHTLLPIHSVLRAGSASGFSMSSAQPRMPLVARERKESVKDGSSEAVRPKPSRMDSEFGAAADSPSSSTWLARAAVERDPSRPTCCPRI